MPEGFESSSTNIARDHGVVNARRSTAITCGRAAELRRLLSNGLVILAWRPEVGGNRGAQRPAARAPRLPRAGRSIAREPRGYPIGRARLAHLHPREPL